MTDYDDFEEAPLEDAEFEVPPQFQDEFSEEEGGKKLCPNCRNELSLEAIRCLFCGEHVPVDSGLLGKIKFRPFRALAVVISGMVILGMLVWFLW